MTFCVVGSGAWGTAFAIHLVRVGGDVTLVPRRPELAAALRKDGENRDYLPGIRLPQELEIAVDAAAALRRADVVLVACPAQAMRETCTRIRQALGDDAGPRLFLSLAKGLELHSHRRPSQVIAEILPNMLAGALTGPTHAEEVARGLPAAMVLATTRPDSVILEAQAAMSGPTLRIYTSNDLIGVELGGCLKNIYAIAAGCCDGLGLGDNARAALLTRALAEMVRVGVALGARLETFYGLSGFGDLVATCHGDWSRNRNFGRRIAQGDDVRELLAHRHTVVEGYATAESLAELCRGLNIDAPILDEVRAILFAGKKPAEALTALMTRELKTETAARGAAK